MKKAILIALAVAFLGFKLWTTRSVSQPAGVLAPDPPLQSQSHAPVFSKGEYTITPLYDFSILGRVLARERYSLGRESELSPVDFAMGWGQMSDTSILESFDISQSGRWYFWQSPSLPIPQSAVVSQSANMHMIPADRSIRDRLLDVLPGNIISIDGYLVRVDASDGWHWKSSTSRSDSGDGSCELVYVKSIEIVD